MNNNLNVFKTMNENDSLNLKSDNLIKYGFITSPKYNNKTILLPNNANDHLTTIRFILGKLFKEERDKYYNLYKEKNLINLEDDNYLMDRDELSMSFFMASLGNLVFLNMSTPYYISGVLFIPENIYCKEIENRKDECLYNIQNDNNLDLSSIYIVPSLNDTLENNRTFKKFDENDMYYKK